MVYFSSFSYLTMATHTNGANCEEYISCTTNTETPGETHTKSKTLINSAREFLLESIKQEVQRRNDMIFLMFVSFSSSEFAWFKLLFHFSCAFPISSGGFSSLLNETHLLSEHPGSFL